MLNRNIADQPRENGGRQECCQENHNLHSLLFIDWNILGCRETKRIFSAAPAGILERGLQTSWLGQVRNIKRRTNSCGAAGPELASVAGTDPVAIDFDGD